MSSSNPTPCSHRYDNSPEEVRFSRLQGLDLVEISNAGGSGRILMQGAQLLDWQPSGQPPLVWLSPGARFVAGKAPRGGIPICWPWFGPHPDDPTQPAHGLARTAPWRVVAVTRINAGQHRLHFRWQPEPRTDWPHRTSLELILTLGSSVEIELSTRNDGTTPLTLSEALHTYLAISDIGQIRVTGLDGCRYVDKTDGGRRTRQEGDLLFSGEVDRVYLDAPGECRVIDPGWGRIIRVESRGSRSTILWNPWQGKASQLGDINDGDYRGMVCVECGNALDNRICLAPGERHTLWARYTTQPLSQSPGSQEAPPNIS